MIRYFLLLTIVTLQNFVFAQGHENTMLFGYQGGHYSPNNPEGGINILRFDEGSLQISDNQFIDMWFNDTNAAISDSSGNLLFYFNGVYLEDISRQIMENGDTLNEYVETGYDLPQGAVIIPYPGHSNQYILFHEEEGYVDIPGWTSSCLGLYYSVIDMTYNNGLGKVVERKMPLLIDTLEYGKLALCQHANGRDWWLAVGKSHTNVFYSILISPKGVQLVGTQSVGLIREDSFGQASFSPDGAKYVISGGYGASINAGQSIEIYDFDRCSGEFSHHHQIIFNDHANTLMGSIISPNSRWLYAPSIQLLYKFDLWADTIESSKELIAEYEPFNDPFPTAFMMGYLAPDNKIYIYTTSGSRTLHVIHKPDEAGTECAFEQHGIRLPCYNSSSLPTFANYRLGPLDGSPCDTLGIDNDPVSWWRYEQDTLNPLAVEFRDLSYHEPDAWAWDFGDGDISTERHPFHTFDSAGIYQVCLTVSNVNGSNTHCKTLYLGVSATDNPVLQNQIVVLPNPFSNRLSIALSTNLRNPIFRLYDQMGRLTSETCLAFGITELETAALPKGIYFWQVSAAGELVKSGKVVKME
jgi:hypothetical protein